MNKKQESKIWDLLEKKGLVDFQLREYYFHQGWTVGALLTSTKQESDSSYKMLEQFNDPEFTGSSFDMGSNRETNLKKVQSWYDRDNKRYMGVQKVFDEVLNNKEESKVEKTIKVVAFTGMVIGEFPVKSETEKYIKVETKKGELVFDKKTGKQTNGKNPKFANKVEVK
jgi:hypothetical protein